MIFHPLLKLIRPIQAQISPDTPLASEERQSPKELNSEDQGADQDHRPSAKANHLDWKRERVDESILPPELDEPTRKRCRVSTSCAIAREAVGLNIAADQSTDQKPIQQQKQSQDAGCSTSPHHSQPFKLLASPFQGGIEIDTEDQINERPIDH